MAQEKSLIVTAAPWSDQAAEFLRDSVLISSVEDYRRAVESEDATLFCVTDDAGETLGFYMLRVDHLAEKTIGTLVAAAGRPGFDFAGRLMPIIEGQFIGCDELIQDCSRPGMARKMVRQGWEATHIRIRKVLKHG